MVDRNGIAAMNAFNQAVRKAFAAGLDTEDLLALLRDESVAAYRKARRENES